MADVVEVVKAEYAKEASNYDTFWSASAPLVRLDTELFISALGKVPGATVLDCKQSLKAIFLFIGLVGF